MGIGLDLLSPGTQGDRTAEPCKIAWHGEHLPERQGEVLLSDEFAQKLKVSPGDTVTLIGSTMNGSMSIYNFMVSGTVSFGNHILDRGAIITDIEDARLALDMADATGEIIGFQQGGFYDNEAALKMADKYQCRLCG